MQAYAACPAHLNKSGDEFMNGLREAFSERFLSAVRKAARHLAWLIAIGLFTAVPQMNAEVKAESAVQFGEPCRHLDDSGLLLLVLDHIADTDSGRRLIATLKRENPSLSEPMTADALLRFVKTNFPECCRVTGVSSRDPASEFSPQILKGAKTAEIVLTKTVKNATGHTVYVWHYLAKYTFDSCGKRLDGFEDYGPK